MLLIHTTGTSTAIDDPPLADYLAGEFSMLCSYRRLNPLPDTIWVAQTLHRRNNETT
ncbi:MAG: hypothetical protein KAR65_10410 [Anaerolineales bacterium]|nr:hypothetical protein [Anaerolineales bacterium]